MEGKAEKIQRYIRPLRFIPFDAGVELNGKALVAVSKCLTSYGYAKIDCPPLLRSLSDFLADGHAVSDTIEVYVYKTGICVIVLEDEAFPILNDSIGVDYCEYRLLVEGAVAICSVHGGVGARCRTLRASSQGLSEGA